ncbi:MAG: recombination mediator RecR [Candidatus Pacebacteria bacterium]|nr:recombination mediator RecR [Candidatus Paceibacterota bacterium]
MYSNSIQKLISLFSKFPTVGPKTAARFVFYLLKLPREQVEEISMELAHLKEIIKNCVLCFLPFEGEGTMCPICSDKTRDRSTLCVVEKEPDLDSIEKTNKYKGLYFILGGNVSPVRKKETAIRSDALLKRAQDPQVNEIILALNPTTEGEATTLYIERLLKPLNKKVTKLGRGLPVGGELEYADEETLSSALEGRK